MGTCMYQGACTACQTFHAFECHGILTHSTDHYTMCRLYCTRVCTSVHTYHACTRCQRTHKVTTRASLEYEHMGKYMYSTYMCSMIYLCTVCTCMNTERVSLLLRMQNAQAPPPMV